MTTIRRLNCFDRPKIKKMISYLGNDDSDKFINALMNEAFVMIHALFPLKYKFLPESYILLEKDEILGLVTVVPTFGNPYKVNITRLIFGQNYYDVGKQLIEFIIARFGAKGASSFIVSVDESHDELLKLFSDGCGFRKCSSESLYKIDNFRTEDNNFLNYRSCQNSDSRAVAKLHNYELINYFKPALERTKQEFNDPLLLGFTNFYKNRYVLEEPSKHKIISYLSVTTNDNLNYIIDLISNSGFNLDYDLVLSFAIQEIARRKTVFYPFVKLKKYCKNAERFENYLNDKGFHKIQTKHILVKDFYKPIKQTESPLQVFLFGESNNFITTN